ncbi:MAG TPA: hypothetical protein VME42_16260 [Steroidobacteraceae bacterium]|nr:hypothetical protein [Steroidobacteraceae bacterium]
MRQFVGLAPLARVIKVVLKAAACAGALALLSAGANAQAVNADQATRMYNRIAGIPPTADELQQMLQAPNAVAAALIATNDHKFYNDTIRNMAAPWTNRNQSVFVPLNDYTATVIGMVRDNVPFNTVLSADILYVGDGTSNEGAYSPDNNNMYINLDAANADLYLHLKKTTQSSLTGIPSTAVAGVMTTRGAASAFFVNGTNRAMFRFTMINHLCNDLPTVMDTTRPPDRIRQDVTRSPGGVSTLFLTNCIGCHSGMDPMAQAFAYYNFSYPASEVGATAWPIGQIVYTAGQTQPKYHINNTNFPQGFNTPDDSWDNRWRTGPNSNLGWSASLPGSGQGAQSLGVELESSGAFASCQVTRVFKTVCYRAPATSSLESPSGDAAQIQSMISSFQSNGYSLRQVFAEAAAYCMGN